MINPLAITELIAKVFENFNTRELVAVSYVNKTWRLEARKKLNENRSDIIYGFFKPYLNDLRLKSLDLSADLLSVIPLQEFKRLQYFIHAFGLDLKTELLAIRNQLQVEYKKLKKICEKLDEKAMEKSNMIISSYAPYSLEYFMERSEYEVAREKADIADKQRFELYRDLINFEYFLVRFADTEVLTEDEIDIIIDSLQPLRDMEEERSWDGMASIIEYWGDEDPDMV